VKICTVDRDQERKHRAQLKVLKTQQKVKDKHNKRTVQQQNGQVYVNPVVIVMPARNTEHVVIPNIACRGLTTEELTK